ncbi:phage baseplate protein, partial [Pseudomonas aeruginosa]
QAEVARSLGRWEPRIGLSAVRVVAVVDGRVDLLLSGVFEGENINMEVSA